MTAFWIIAACFVAAALLFVLPPLLAKRDAKPKLARQDITVSIYRDAAAELENDLRNGTLNEDQYQQARQELERRLLEDVAAEPAAEVSGGAGVGRWAAIAVGLAVPLLAVGLYFKVGTPRALTEDVQRTAAGGGHSQGQMSEEEIKDMAARLAARLEQNPDDAEGWGMLARTSAALGRYAEAARAYKRLTELIPGNAQLLADYADILAMAQGRRLTGEPLNIIQQALKADPKHPKALALAGTAAFEAKDYQGAVAYWERLRAELPPGSEGYQSVSGGIAEARALASGASPEQAMQAAAQASSQGAAPAAGAAKVAGQVTLSPALKDKVAPGDTLFVFARAASGPKMPLAILRFQAKDLPTTFTLDDSTAMNAAMKISNFPEVVVGARVSKSGNATPQAGDLEGLSGPVKVGSANLEVVIDRVVQ